MEMLHVYAELVAAGVPAEQRYPGIAAHLRACGPCGEHFEGLLAAVRDDAYDRHPLLAAPPRQAAISAFAHRWTGGRARSLVTPSGQP
jgi:hypothetical protein